MTWIQWKFNIHGRHFLLSKEYVCFQFLPILISLATASHNILQAILKVLPNPHVWFCWQVQVWMGGEKNVNWTFWLQIKWSAFSMTMWLICRCWLVLAWFNKEGSMDNWMGDLDTSGWKRGNNGPILSSVSLCYVFSLLECVLRGVAWGKKRTIAPGAKFLGVQILAPLTWKSAAPHLCGQCCCSPLGFGQLWHTSPGFSWSWGEMCQSPPPSRTQNTQHTLLGGGALLAWEEQYNAGKECYAPACAACNGGGGYQVVWEK